MRFMIISVSSARLSLRFLDARPDEPLPPCIDLAPVGRGTASAFRFARRPCCCRAMSQFIEREAEGEEDEGHDDDEGPDDEGDIRHLIRDKTKRDRDGLHLEAGAKRRLEEEEEEAARLEEAAKRYERMGAAYINARDGGSSFTADSEMSEIARAQKAAREREEYERFMAERAAEEAAAAREAKLRADKQQALYDLYGLDESDTAAPGAASSSAAAAANANAAGASCSASTSKDGDSVAGASESKGKYRIKKRKT